MKKDRATNSSHSKINGNNPFPAGPTTSNQLKEKFSEMKTKLTDYITNSELMASGPEEERHITPSPGGKRYRSVGKFLDSIVNVRCKMRSGSVDVCTMGKNSHESRHLLAPLAHSLAPYCLLHSLAPPLSLVCLLAYSLTHSLVRMRFLSMIGMPGFHSFNP